MIVSMEELEQPEVLGSKQEFGKFKDAESLLKAYNRQRIDRAGV